MEMSTPTYQSNTMLAFVDILGFKNILSKKTLQEILDITNSILQADNSPDYLEMLPTLKTKLISDSFVVYAQILEPNHIVAFNVYLSTIIAGIHRLGRVVTRGFISAGDHYSDDTVWISPTFVEAYTGEENFSIHPRVILGDSAIQLINNIHPEFIMSGFLKRDLDGYYFVNYLNCIANNYKPSGGTINAYMNPGDLEISLQDHVETILNGILNEKQNINKYIWLANYHNNYLIENIKIKNIEQYLIEVAKY